LVEVILRRREASEPLGDLARSMVAAGLIGEPAEVDLENNSRNLKILIEN
jgi:hypothetical protein